MKNDPVKERNELRPHGINAAGCNHCAFLNACGGIQPSRPLWDCFELNCCKKPESCTLHCANNPRFSNEYREIHGYLLDGLSPVRQHKFLRLPAYIPLIENAYDRDQDFDYPLVALKTSSVLKKKGAYGPVANNGRELRQRFKLGTRTRIILRGVDKDPALERYWSERTAAHAPELLSGLGISMAIGPNFSHILDVPRTDNLRNRKRQWLCLSELNDAGVVPVPHLNRAQPGDWNGWADYLRANTGVLVVAKEFETGDKNVEQGQAAIDEIAGLQDRIARPLALVLVGGARFVDYASSKFDLCSVLDSTPFMKARFRQRLYVKNGKLSFVRQPLLPGLPLDDLLLENVRTYARWIERKMTRRLAAAVSKVS